MEEIQKFVRNFFEDLMNRLDENTQSLESLSTLGIKYPKLRDAPLKTGYSWLESKRIDDGAEGLWRIHNNLYDLKGFVDKHPGGNDWLRLTQGTDITEAFESHHLTTPDLILKEYYVKKAKIARNSPFTFDDNGFYKTLKKEIKTVLKTIPKNTSDTSKRTADILFINYIFFAVISVTCKSFFLGTISGVFLALTAIAAHNFFHQKDNFRMYYFDFTMLQSREWRISHALSHHLYTNSINDLEISTLEPFLQYLPTRKHFIFRYVSWLYSPIVWAFLYFGSFIRVLTEKFIKREKLTFDIFLPFTVPLVMYLITGESLIFCLTMFAWITVISSVYFGAVGLNAGHHHPEVFHDGDATRVDNMDWGVFQLDAVADRKEIAKSQFWSLTSFGNHALHHLFPTLDHAILPYLYPKFLQVCQDFNLEWKATNQLEAARGQFLQLAKVKGNENPPGTVIFNKSN